MTKPGTAGGAWHADRPGEVIGLAVTARLRAWAWALDRPARKPTTLRWADLNFATGRLGHSTVTTTMNIYSRVAPTVQKTAADRFAAHLEGS